MKNFFESLQQVRPNIQEHEIQNALFMIRGYLKDTKDRINMKQDVNALFDKLEQNIKNQLLELDYNLSKRLQTGDKNFGL